MKNGRFWRRFVDVDGMKNNLERNSNDIITCNHQVNRIMAHTAGLGVSDNLPRQLNLS